MKKKIKFVTPGADWLLVTQITSYLIESLKFSENLHITADIRRNDGEGK